MLKNKKAFTIIELIVSFLFISILAISLFSIIINYRNKAVNTEIELDLLSFISKVKIDIQKDIDNKLLKNIDNCKNGEDFIERCVILTFEDNTTKMFRVGFTLEVDEITGKDGDILEEYSFKVPYISYGGIKYNIPDSHNVEIRNDFMFESTYLNDALESNKPLYKISVSMVHKELEEDVVFKIVASGSTNLTTGQTPPYKSYNVGDVVTVQLNKDVRRKFRVIKSSNGFNSMFTLLYDDVNLNINTVFNNLSAGNNYPGSQLNERYNTISRDWKNARTVRALTADEVAYIANLCPQFREPNSLDQSLSSAPAWLTSHNYWLSSKKEYTNANQGQMVWIINGTAKTMTSRNISTILNASVRPVIEMNKIYDITT